MLRHALGLVALAAFMVAGPAAARDRIEIAGSSTILPYSTIVAEMFAEETGHPKPDVASGGSAHGLSAFCEGVGVGTIDIANASRRIRPKELAACGEAGVSDIIEVRIGYDGIVFASSVDGPDFSAFQSRHWYLALAADLPVGGTLVANPNSVWSEIDPALPNVGIQAFIPGVNHGTRDVFEDRVIFEGCRAAGAYDALLDLGLNATAAKAACTRLRTDGRAHEIEKDYTETLALIDLNVEGVGVFGLAFYENNRDKLKVARIDGVMPTAETIAEGTYPVSRPLYFYVKRAHFNLVAGLKDYVRLFVSEEVAGPDGPLSNFGLVPDPALGETREAVQRERLLEEAF